MTEDVVLGRDDLPVVYRAASDESRAGQERFQRGNRWGLFLLVGAAAAGLGSIHVQVQTHLFDVLGIVAAVCFFAAIILRLFQLVSHPDKVWYDGRIVAESTKTLAWRYAVGGEPFSLALSPKLADELLGQRLHEILTDIEHLELEPAMKNARQITERMRQLRGAALSVRRASYAKGRIEDQRGWYAYRAKQNKRSARRWNAFLILVEVVGAGEAVLKATGILPIDLLGVIGTVAAAAVSWVQAKQFQALAQTYALASHELTSIGDRLAHQDTEPEWALFVNDAEEAISREHTLWRASRSESRLPI